MKTWVNNRFGIPIKILIRDALCPEGFLVAKAAIIYKNWMGQINYLGGFSFDNDINKVPMTAQYELLERFLATYDFNARYLDDENIFPCYSWPDGHFVMNIHASKVLIGPTPYALPSVEASGLGLHTKRQLAEEHGLFELIERHLCCRLWYAKETKIMQIGETIHLSSGFTLSHYTLCLPELIPFVLSVIYSNQRRILVCGHSVKKTFTEAIQKASSEAFMLLDCLLNSDDGYCTNERTKNRILSLQGKTTEARYPYLFSKLDSFQTIQSQLDYFYETEVILRNSIPTQQGILMVPITQFKDFFLVRTICKEAETLKDWRYFRTRDTSIPDDPFC